MSKFLPTDSDGLKQHRAAYFIHKITNPVSENHISRKEKLSEETELVGTVFLRPDLSTPLPEKFIVPNGPEIGVLLLEIGYFYLPAGWGQGFATEALIAVLNSIKTANDFLAPYTKLYVLGMVGHENPASVRVLEKCGMESVGTNEWEGEPVYLAGAWRRPRVLAYGQWLIK
jgi:RimJ/RimL family protein N-acetyltransferase